MSPVSLPHQQIVQFLLYLMMHDAEDNDTGKVLMTPFQMRLRSVRRGREPDLIFMLKANLGRLQHNYLDGPADLAVEVVSPESMQRDRETKYGEYEQAGVREYWVLDPDTQRADFFVLSAAGRCEPMAPDASGVYRSAMLPGFWLNVNWLWQQPLPALRQILREWERSL